MTTQKQSFIAQIAVAIVVGLLSSLGTGSLTAYVLTNKFDKKLYAHMIQSASTEAQIRSAFPFLKRFSLGALKFKNI